MVTSFSGGRSWSTRRKPPIMGKQLVNFITCGCESSVPFCNLQSRARTHAVLVIGLYHCRQRAPVGNALSSSGTSQLGMFDIQATTKSKYYDHIVLLYLESRRCRYRSIIFACFYLYITVVIFIDYSDIDKMMDINNEKC
jgi:hypothetical protein